MSLSPIAVIGAGMAGLSCAQTLAQAGLSVHLFDKSRGPSGRMSTRRAEDPQGAWQCDHGAPFFTATDLSFREEVMRWEQCGAAASWPVRIARHDGQRLVAMDTSTQRFVGTGRMTAPAALLVRELAALPGQPVHMHLQTTVQGMQAGEAGWTLQSAEHGRSAVGYRAVLVAIPAPQAHALLAASMPQAAQLASSARMDACWTVMLRSDHPVQWPCDGAIIEQGPLRWVARDSSKPGRTGPETWIVHASAQWSADHLEDDAASVTAQLLQAFADMGGPAPGSLRATAHRWRYANAAPGLGIDCWWDASHAVGMCGDWLHDGGVQGAWLSGRALARRALQTLAA